MTVTTCATCPLSRQIEDTRYECTSPHKSAVTRGHWQATPDCEDAIAAYWDSVDAQIAAQQKPRRDHHIECTYHVS